MAEFRNLIPRGKQYKERREHLDSKNFKSLYCFSKVNVDWLNQYLFGPEKVETRGGAIKNIVKLKAFLRLIGDPGFQCGIGEDLGIHQTTVSKNLVEVMDLIMSKAAVWIKFPQTDMEFDVAKQEWQEKYNFPAAIGALDCTHIPINKPGNNGDEYVNRKGYPSINVQATCNAKEVFTSVDVSWPGSVHDSRIWRNSDINTKISRNRVNALLLSDSGYGLAPWLMTPFRNPQTPQETAYNRCITRERVVIERCFGQLKQRFPILQHKVRLSLNKIPKLIVCCFVLHNIAKHLQDEDPELPLFGENVEPVQEIENDIAVAANIRQNGEVRRNQLADIILQVV